MSNSFWRKVGVSCKQPSLSPEWMELFEISFLEVETTKEANTNCDETWLDRTRKCVNTHKCTEPVCSNQIFHLKWTFNNVKQQTLRTKIHLHAMFPAEICCMTAEAGVKQRSYLNSWIWDKTGLNKKSFAQSIETWSFVVFVARKHKWCLTAEKQHRKWTQKNISDPAFMNERLSCKTHDPQLLGAPVKMTRVSEAAHNWVWIYCVTIIINFPSCMKSIFVWHDDLARRLGCILYLSQLKTPKVFLWVIWLVQPQPQQNVQLVGQKENKRNLTTNWRQFTISSSFWNFISEQKLTNTHFQAKVRSRGPSQRPACSRARQGDVRTFVATEKITNDRRSDLLSRHIASKMVPTVITNINLLINRKHIRWYAQETPRR